MKVNITRDDNENQYQKRSKIRQTGQLAREGASA
jgi:hypothetical protein